jgi:MoxR-like ATPase
MEARLVVVSGRHAGREFGLTASPVSLGSGAGCDVALPDAGLADRHALLVEEFGCWYARPLPPSGSIEFRGRLVSDLRLEPGMRFRVGEAEMRFDAAAARLDVPAGEGGAILPEEGVRQLHAARERLVEQVGRVIVGQRTVIDQVLVALFAQGHCLLIGVPGLGKTLLVRTLAAALDLESRRIQFTPDLMPADITGTDILEEDAQTGARRFRFNRGPVFTNLLLADEINRTPPKTQAALLEAMQERRVTAAGLTHDLPAPFLVLATQNPIELEGTYPLPEAQLDRFMFAVNMDYPSASEEPEILLSTTTDRSWEVARVLDAPAILRFQRFVRQVPVSPHVGAYAARLVRASRPGQPEAPPFVTQWLRWGAGPRAGQCLLLAAKAHAVLAGRFTVSCADVRAYAAPVLRHRLFRNFAAVSDGIAPDAIVTRLLEHVTEPEY